MGNELGNASLLIFCTIFRGKGWQLQTNHQQIKFNITNFDRTNKAKMKCNFHHGIFHYTLQLIIISRWIFLLFCCLACHNPWGQGLGARRVRVLPCRKQKSISQSSLQIFVKNNLTIFLAVPRGHL